MATLPPIALDIKPPAPTQGPLDQYQQAMSVQTLINQHALQQQEQQKNAISQQQQQIELENQQQQQKDTQTFNKVFHDANGDWDTAIKNAPQAGVSGQYVIKAQLARSDQVAKMATANSDLLKNEAAKADVLGKDASTILGISDPVERQLEYARLRNGHIASGAYKASELPENVPSDKELQSTVAHSKAAQDMMGEALKLQEQKAKLPGEQAESTAKGYATAAQTMGGANEQLSWTARRNFAVKQNPDIAQLIPEQYSPEAAEQVRQLGVAPKDLATMAPDKLELQDWLKKHPGKGPADFMAYKATLVPAYNFNLANNTGGGNAAPADIAKKFGMTQTAFDQAAEKYATTGQLPAVGRGPNGIALQRAIMNRTGELHGGESLAANSAEFKANSASLNKLQTNLDNVTAFENTALKNLDQVALTGSKIPDLSARFANVPVRMISSQMIGTPEMAQFKTALLTAQNEAAKVLTSANANGVLSDSARHEAQEVLDGNLPFPAMMASINQLKTDFGNRHQSYAEQVSDIQKRLGNKAPVSQGEKGNSGHVISINGKNYRYKGSGPTNDMKSYDPI